MCEAERALETANKVYNKQPRAWVHLAIDVVLLGLVAAVVIGSVAVFFFK